MNQAVDRRWRMPEGEFISNGWHAVGIVQDRIDSGIYETWLCGPDGHSIALVTNGVRAMVMLLAGEDDPGEHAVDPVAQESQDGFVLANGQWDSYDNRDTVRLGDALVAVAHLVDHGGWPDSVSWQSDR